MKSEKKYINTGAYLRTLYNGLVANLHARLAEEGYSEISPSHGLIFQYINEKGSRITDLAFQAGITKQSMSALVSQLESFGYLKRRDDPEDARAVLFILSAKGELLKSRAQEINRQFEKKWAEKLGDMEYQRFRTMIQRLADSDLEGMTSK